MIRGDFLQTVPLLRGLNAEELELLGDAVSEWECARGQTIFKEGDPADNLYLLREGEVELLISSGIVVNHCLATLRAGDVLGEVSFLDQKPRLALARCLGKVTLVSFSRDDLRRLQAVNPNIQRVLYRNLARQVAARLRTASLRLRELAGRDKSLLAALSDVYSA